MCLREAKAKKKKVTLVNQNQLNNHMEGWENTGEQDNVPSVLINIINACGIHSYFKKSNNNRRVG